MNELSEQYHVTTRTCPAWADEQRSLPTMVHTSSCQRDEEKKTRCSCRSAMSRIPAGTLVSIARRGEGAILVVPSGMGAVWIEEGTLARAKSPRKRPREGIPEDYVEAELRRGEGIALEEIEGPIPGGGLSLLRDDPGSELWRYVGRIHQDGELRALLVRASLPLERVLDADRDSVRVEKTTNAIGVQIPRQ